MNSMLLTVTLPLWSTIWQAEPLDEKNTSTPVQPTYLSESETASYMKRTKDLSDPRIMSSIVRDIAQTNNAETITILYSFLNSKLPQAPQTEALAQLFALKDKITAPDQAKLSPFLKSPLHLQRAYAGALLATVDSSHHDLLTIVQTDSSEFVISSITTELLKAGQNRSFDILKKTVADTESFRTPYLLQLLTAGKTDPDSITELMTIVQGSDSVLKAAIARGLNTRESGGIQVLETLRSSDDPCVRYLAAQSKGNKDLTTGLIAMANDPQTQVAVQAVLSIGYDLTPASTTKVIEKLSNENKTLREAAATSLIRGKVSSEKLIQKLRATLIKPGIHDAALRLIATLKLEGLNKEIIRAAEIAEHTQAKERALQTIATLNIRQALEPVLKLAKDSAAAVRLQAAKTLLIFDKADTLSTIKQLISDKDSTVVVQAIETAGRIADPSFSPLLGKKLSDMNAPADVRSAACWAIARCGNADKQAVSQLKTLCIKKAISIEGEKDFDSLIVRISAYYAMIDLVKKDQKYNSDLADLEKSLRFAADKEFKRYLKQARAYQDGKTAKPTVAEPPKPQLTVRKI